MNYPFGPDMNPKGQSGQQSTLYPSGVDKSLTTTDENYGTAFRT